jgi:hypothetical protein
LTHWRLLRDIEGCGEPTWKGQWVIVCLTEQHITDLGEDEMLGDLKEGGRMGDEIGTDSSDLCRDSTEEEENDEVLQYRYISIIIKKMHFQECLLLLTIFFRNFHLCFKTFFPLNSLKLGV